MKKCIKSILILPFNVTVIVPLLILYFSKYEYSDTNFYRLVFGILLLLTGLFFATWTIILFYKIGKGTLAPWAPPKYLITEGPYQYTRNPMITGVLFILFSEYLILNSINLLYWFVFFFLLNCIYFKLFEEKQLVERFGEEYLNYRENVPMWIPKFIQKKTGD